MDTWTALMLSRLRTCELRREAAQHRLAKLAAASTRTSAGPVWHDTDCALWRDSWSQP